MTTAAILTRITTRLDGDTPINIASLFDDVTPAIGDSYEDIVESAEWPPNPNVVIVKAVICPETLALIQLNPQYGRGAILWRSGEVFDAPMGEKKYGLIAAHLTRLLHSHNVPETWVRENVLGPTSQTLGQMLDHLIAWLRQPTLPATAT